MADKQTHRHTDKQAVRCIERSTLCCALDALPRGQLRVVVGTFSSVFGIYSLVP
jgi:hypothetical protein